MSVDERLRDGLRTRNESWTPDPTAAYASVVADARRTRVRRNVTIGGVTAAALLVTALAVAAPGEQPPSTQPAPSAPERSDGSAREVYPTSPLDGHWRTAPLDRARARVLLGEAGLEASFARWARSRPGERPRLTIVASSVIPYSVWLGTGSDPYAENLESGFMRVRGPRVLLVGEGDGPRTTLRWTRTGQQLRLDVVATNRPDRRGTSGETQARALFASETFLRYVSPGP